MSIVANGEVSINKVVSIAGGGVCVCCVCVEGKRTSCNYLPHWRDHEIPASLYEMFTGLFFFELAVNVLIQLTHRRYLIHQMMMHSRTLNLFYPLME